MASKKKDKSPTKSSPASKRSKVTGACGGDQQEVRGQGDVNMAAPMDFSCARSLNLNTDDSVQDTPPRWFTLFFKDFEVRLEHRLESIIIKRLDELAAQDHEEKFTACSMKVDDMQAEVDKLKKEKDAMLVKLDDLENRSRRNNLVFHGVPEQNGKEDCLQTVSDILHNIVGMPHELCQQVERCHRTPTHAASVNKDKPRIIHTAFSSFATKEKIRKECMKKFARDQYKGKKLFVSEDFSARVLQLRRGKMDLFKRLKAEGKKPFFVFPDKIKYSEPSTEKVISVN